MGNLPGIWEIPEFFLIPIEICGWYKFEILETSQKIFWSLPKTEAFGKFPRCPGLWEILGRSKEFPITQEFGNFPADSRHFGNFPDTQVFGKFPRYLGIWEIHENF